MKVQGHSDSYSLFDAQNKKADDKQQVQNDWDQKYAHRFGSNAAVWTVAAGSGHVQ